LPAKEAGRLVHVERLAVRITGPAGDVVKLQ